MSKYVLLVALWLPFLCAAQQVVDSDFKPKDFACYFCQTSPAPVVAIDGAHHNFHTLDGRYEPFAKTLSADGLTLVSNTESFSRATLAGFDVLVIANAVNEKNKENWSLPNYPAFTRDEVEAVYRWVNDGGALFLIADHMPWPKAMSDLSEMFGVGFINGYVEIIGQQEQFFKRRSNSVLTSAVTPEHGDNAINVIQGFLGQGFTLPPNAQPVLQFTEPSINWMPAKSWEIDDSTPSMDATGLYQGAILKVGKGKVAVFGEAGMFTAQIVKTETEYWAMGMNSPKAIDNQQLLLNVVRWLVN